MSQYLKNGCKILAENEYKKRYYKIYLYVHCLLCPMDEYQVAESWFEHMTCRTIEDFGNLTVFYEYDFQTVTQSLSGHYCAR